MFQHCNIYTLLFVCNLQYKSWIEADNKLGQRGTIHCFFFSGFRCFSAVGNPTVGLACPDLARYFLLKITMLSLKCYKSLAISEGITFVFCIVFSKCLPCFGLPWRTLVSVIFWIPLQMSFKIIINPKSASIPVNLEP